MEIQKWENCFPAHFFVSKIPFGIEVCILYYYAVISSYKNLNLMGFNLYFLVIWDFMESGMKDTVNLHLHAITILKKKKKNLEQNKVYMSLMQEPRGSMAV